MKRRSEAELKHLNSVLPLLCLLSALGCLKINASESLKRLLYRGCEGCIMAGLLDVPLKSEAVETSG